MSCNQHIARKAFSRTAFSLVELIIVIVIIGIIAAIAAPKITQGSSKAGESALRNDVATLRNAIDLYAAEHEGKYPSANAAGGTFGAADSADAFKNQLLYFTDRTGTVSQSKDAAYPLGPYLRHDIPNINVGPNVGTNGVTVTTDAGPLTVTEADGNAWKFSNVTGEFIANTDDASEGGSTYSTW